MLGRLTIFGLTLILLAGCRGKDVATDGATNAAATAENKTLPSGMPEFRLNTDTTIPAYRDVKEKSKEEYGYVPGPLLRRVADGTLAERLASFNRGFEADSVAEQLRFADGSTGWVDIAQILVPYRLGKAAAFFTAKPTAGQKGEMLPAGSVVAAQTIAFDYKGIDPGDGIPVRLTDGRHGYLIADADSSWGGKAEKLDGSYLLVGQPRPALLLTEQ